MASGRKSVKEEMGIFERYSQLAPKAFQFVSEMFISKKLEDRKWAADWLKGAYTKMIPQAITGKDGKDLFPTPLLANLDVPHNNSIKENSGADKTDTSDTGGDVGLKDHIDNLISD